MAMKKLKGDEEKLDGLEITSIGSLYAGLWDKKYWSSSRGKDRYPYPVGYQAVRAYDESTYRMEIHEGPKGPLFLITSADGHSSSGQTPDIAWDKFQKKYCPHIKVWPGNRKRFSCNIDGVEFFGFKNPFVQRLLREMVANVSGSAEQNLLPSSFCKEAPKTNEITCCPDACKSCNLLPYLERPMVTGKRSRRREVTSSTMPSSEADLKRSRPQGKSYVAEASHPIEQNRRTRGIQNVLPSLEEDCEKPSVVPPSLDLIPGQEKKGYIAENDLPLDNVENTKQLRSAVSAEETMLIDSEQCSATDLAGNLPTKETPRGKILKYSQLDSLQVGEVENCAFPMALDVGDGETTGPGDCQVLKNFELYATDTLDFEQGAISDDHPSAQDKVNKEEVTAADMINLEGLVSGSNPDDEMGTSNSNGGSEKSDFDSVGHETAKCMMTFLLPQAIPLLKKTSRKKKAAVSPLEIPSCGVNTQKENKEHISSSPGLIKKKISDVKAHVNIESTNISSTDTGNCVVFDNAIDQICADSYSEINPSGDAKSDQNTLSAETRLCNKCGQYIGNGEHIDSLDCYLETHGNKDIFCYDDVHMHSRIMLPQDDTVAESLQNLTVPDRKDISADIRNDKAALVEKFEVVGTESTNDVQPQGMLSSSHVQWEEPGIHTTAAETSTVFSQVPRLVYSRRKKVKTKYQMKESYSGPLSESIICRSSVDGSISETCETKSNSIALETPQMSTLDDKPHKKEFSAQPKVLGQSKSLIVDRPKMDFEGLQNNMVSAVSLDQFSKCKGLGTRDFLDQPGSHVQKSNIHVDKMVGNKNRIAPNCSESSQKQGEVFSKSSSDANGFQDCPDLMSKGIESKKHLLGIFETVGCYLHPLPVLSLMVSTIHGEIHICVVCGVLVSKDRTIFIYKIATQEPTVGYPSFIGHTSVTFPILKDYFGKEISLERCGLHFTPEGQHLVLLDSIETPYCRLGRIPCLCSACVSESFEGDAVKIVEVKSGYVSVVAKLKAVESLLCDVICEPNYLVAVGESGRLHLWVMNSAWSAHTDKFSLPENDLGSPGIVELKRIPKSGSFVVGHNGFGEFSLWDISKRILVSKFSGLSTSFFDFLPVGLFRWKKNCHSFSKVDVDGHVNRMMAATNMWFSEQTNDASFLPFEEDIAVWLLVSVTSDSDAHHDYISGNYKTNSAARWRLALLVKNTVNLGSPLDPSATVFGTSAGHGIIGTNDGLVYLWEMSTGAKLGTSHHFKGSTVSCIATDGSKNGAVAIAGGEGQLLVYVPSQKNMAK